MNVPLRDLQLLLKKLQPTVLDGEYAFATVASDVAVSDLVPLATFREAEGLSVIVRAEQAQNAGLPILFRAACITLRVNSDLHAVGLTAAVAACLAEQGIPCNVVAAAHHDHLFVPPDRVRDSIDRLRQLSDGASDMIAGLHHAQITIPIGAEQQGRSFYCGVLGLTELPKPEPLRSRGGFWLKVGDREVHVGVEDGVDRASTKAHLAYSVRSLADWREVLSRRGVELIDGVPIPGFARFEFRDPFGNRVEMIEKLAGTTSAGA